MATFDQLVEQLSRKQQRPMQGSSFDTMFNQMLQQRQQQQQGYLDSAKQLAQGILQFQKQQRAEPFIRALEQYGQQYAQAQDEAARQQAHAAANAARAAFLQQGGSPYDLPQNLWGANPLAGFQVAASGENAFVSPYTGDNLTYAQRAALAKMQQDALASELERRKFEEIDLPLTQAQIPLTQAQIPLLQAQTANYWRSANEPYSGSSLDEQILKTQMWIEEEATKRAKERMEQLKAADKSDAYTMGELIDYYRTQLVNSLGLNPQ